MTANRDPGTSAKPGKQRKRDADADHNQRRKMMSAHLSEDLMLDFDRRSMPVREGDTVRVTRGDFSGHEGEVLAVDHKRSIVEVDGATNRSADGSQVPRPIHPSNVVITDLHLTDPQRRAALERKGVEVEAPPEPEPEEEDEEEAEAEDEGPAEDEETETEPPAAQKGPDHPAPEPDEADEVEPEADEPGEEPDEALDADEATEPDDVEAEPETEEAPDEEADEADEADAEDDEAAEAEPDEAADADATDETADEADDDTTEEETR